MSGQGCYDLAPRWGWLNGLVRKGNFMASMTAAERFLSWRDLGVLWWERLDGAQRRVWLRELSARRAEFVQERRLHV